MDKNEDELIEMCKRIKRAQEAIAESTREIPYKGDWLDILRRACKILRDKGNV